MFDIGFWELVFLFGLGLMVLGPERMPQVAAKLGRWAGQARIMARNLTSQIREEIEPIQSSVDSMHESMNETLNETVGDPLDNQLGDQPGESSSKSPEGETIKPRKDWSAQRPEPGQPAPAAEPDEDS